MATRHRRFVDMVGAHDLHLVRLYRTCTAGFSIEWPDGRPLIDQPVKLVSAFGIIGTEIQRHKKGA